MPDPTIEARPDRGNRLVVRSLGTADASVIGALRQIRQAPDVELAAIVYRAPAELLADVDADTGSRLVDLLRQTGLDVALVPSAQPFEPGTDAFEVSLAIQRYDAMVAIIEETVRVTGLDVDGARRVVCASPAVLLGGVSQATVDALRRRFAPLGVEVDASQTSEALFDIAVEADDVATRNMVATLLPDAFSAAGRSEARLLLSTGYDAATAARAWDQLSRTAAKVRILNRDLLRFDVRIDDLPDTEGAKQWLIGVTGMRAAVADRASARTPFVIAENASAARMLEVLGEAQAHGARASGVLLALQRFALDVKDGGDRDAVARWVDLIGGRADSEAFARGGAARLPGPFTKTAARWLQLELRRVGVASQLAER